MNDFDSKLCVASYDNSNENIDNYSDFEGYNENIKSAPRTSKNLPCKSCDMNFDSYKEFDSHNWEFHKFKPFCDICGKVFNMRISIIKHKKLHETGKSMKQLSCKICQIVYENFKDFDKHNLEVHQIKPSCDICGKVFKQRKDLWNHKQEHKEEKTLSCEFCHIDFNSYTSFDTHNLKIHQINPSCDICGKVFSHRSDIRRHRRKHTGVKKTLKCQDCGRAFYEMFYLKRHQEKIHGKETYGNEGSEHNNESENLSCEEIGSLKNDKVHSKTEKIEKKEIREIELRESDTNMNSKTRKPKNIPCITCHMFFDTYKDFDAHNWDVHQTKPSCDICGKFFSTRKIITKHKKLHANGQAQKQLPCGICQMIFITYKDFDDHNLEVHKLKPSCDICGNIFKTRMNLNKHKELHNEEESPKQLTQEKNLLNKNNESIDLSRTCTICQIKFITYKELDAHNWEVHQIEIPCDTCNQLFKNRKDLWSHSRKEHKKEKKKEKSFPCEVCGKKFFNMSHLKVHHMVHTDERPFLCNDCGQGFRSAFQLKQHERIHTGEKPFVCELCNKRFRLKEILNNHMRMHTGEKPFSCEDCGSSFKQRCDLTIHKRIHTGEKPYSCELCQKFFYSSSELTKHNKTSSHLNMIKTPKVDEENDVME